MDRLDILNPFGETIYYKDITDSTMIDLVSLGQAPHGTIVMAGYQRQGRGRGELRRWESSPGENLLFSLALSPGRIVHPLLRVPLICGLALAEYLRDEYGLDAQLKWPNDVLVNERKIAGILCEYRAGRLLLGMGVNCLQRDFDSTLADRVTSLSLQGIEECTPVKILQDFLGTLQDCLGREDWSEDAHRLLYKRGEQVSVCMGPPEEERESLVTIEGLTQEGFLIVRLDPGGERLEISAGEIRYTAFK